MTVALSEAVPAILTQQGYAIVPGVISGAACATLADALGRNAADAHARSKMAGVYAMRNLLRLPDVRDVACSSEIRRIVEPCLGPAYRAVRCILFDKTPGANWKVAWHQDLSIAVKTRVDVPGFGPWSIKAGVQHVQPPADVLEGMLTVRLHLDDCDAGNGPLRVLPGSHAHGVIADAQIVQWRQTVAAVTCLCPAGGVVLMRPLLLHASSSALLPRHRRVVHIEFAAGDLPGGLEWSQQ